MSPSVRTVLVRVGIALAGIAGLWFIFGTSEPGSEVVDGEGILGTYTVNGVDVRGEEYSGTVIIDAGDGVDEYVVQWLVSGAIQSGVGVGVLDGDEFEVTWLTVSSGSGDATGTGSYVVQPNGDLVGTRTIDGIEGTGTEISSRRRVR